MKMLILGLSVILLTALPSSQIVRNPDEPPKYADGVFCTPKGDRVHGVQTDIHKCECKNMRMQDKDGCCETRVNNDPVCKQYCNEKACACPTTCVNSNYDPVDPPSTPAEPIGPNQ